jgi:uncharacterized protein
MNEVKSFLGTGWSFPVAFDDSIGVTMVSDAEDIRQSIILLLNTTPGERVTNPQYGCDLHSKIFKSISVESVTEIEEMIATAIGIYEPRVKVEEIDIDTTEELEGVVLINLVYIIRRVNTRTNMVFPFYKLEGTNIVEE